MVASFILAIVTTIRAIFEFFAHQAEKHSGKDNKIVKAMVSCMRCCLACVEKCIQYLTENAVIHMAFTGHWYFSSCCQSLQLLLQEFMLFFLIGFLSTSFSLLGVLLISLSNGLIG